MRRLTKKYLLYLGALLCHLIILEQTSLAGELSANGEKFDITVSSVLSSSNNLYSVEHLFGDDPSRTWCKGKEGDGIGEWIQVDFKGEPKSEYIENIKLKLLPGYAKSNKLFVANARPSKINVEIVDRVAKTNPSGKKNCIFNVQDKPALQIFTIPVQRALDTSKLRVFIKVEGVHKGSMYKDMCISEINIDLIGKKKNILDMTQEEYEERKRGMDKETAIIKKDLPKASTGNEGSIQRLIRLASGEYIKSAEGGEWLNEIYLDLMVKQPSVYFSILMKQDDEVINESYKQLTHPVNDKYSKGQFLTAVNQAKRHGIEFSLLNDLIKTYSEK